MLRAFILCSILAMSVSASGNVHLKPVHPDEPADFTYSERFSVKCSLESLDAIESALDSLRKLTEAADLPVPLGR